MMSRRVTHRITLPNPETRLGLCNKCGPVFIYPEGSRWWCGAKRKRKPAYGFSPLPEVPARSTQYRKYKGDSCVLCGFVPEDPCQLDVDHIDGNHSNDEPSNLRTLCANCHRIETKKNKQGAYAGPLLLKRTTVTEVYRP